MSSFNQYSRRAALRRDIETAAEQAKALRHPAPKDYALVDTIHKLAAITAELLLRIEDLESRLTAVA